MPSSGARARVRGLALVVAVLGTTGGCGLPVDAVPAVTDLDPPRGYNDDEVALTVDTMGLRPSFELDISAANLATTAGQPTVELLPMLDAGGASPSNARIGAPSILLSRCRGSTEASSAPTPRSASPRAVRRARHRWRRPIRHLADAVYESLGADKVAPRISLAKPDPVSRSSRDR